MKDNGIQTRKKVHKIDAPGAPKVPVNAPWSHNCDKYEERQTERVSTPYLSKLVKIIVQSRGNNEFSNYAFFKTKPYFNLGGRKLFEINWGIKEIID